MLDFAGFMAIFTRARLFPWRSERPAVDFLSRAASRRSRCSSGVVMLLVPALAWMQYQWLGQLSTAERERMQRTLRTAAAQFATEFDSELSRTLVSLQVDGPTIRDQNWTALRAALLGVGEQRQRTAAGARRVAGRHACPAPTLPPLDGARQTRSQSISCGCAGGTRRRWRSKIAAWPDDLDRRCATSLATHFIGFQVGTRGNWRRIATAPGIASRGVAVALARRRQHADLAGDAVRRCPTIAAARRRSRSSASRSSGSIRPSFATRCSPRSTARHFHGDDAEVDYRVAVVKKDDPQKVVWESEPGIARR